MPRALQLHPRARATAWHVRGQLPLFHAAPVLQDDVINLEAGTVNTTHGFRLGGGFDQIPVRRRLPGPDPSIWFLILCGRVSRQVPGSSSSTVACGHKCVVIWRGKRRL